MSDAPRMPEGEVLCAYLDGECTEAERAWVEARLADSEETRVALAELGATRDAVRALPRPDPPAEFWARVLADGPETIAVADAPVDLAAARHRRRPSRWLAATAATAAAVIVAVVLIPAPQTVTPPVAVFTDAHAVRTSLQDDAPSALAPLAVAAGFRR